MRIFGVGGKRLEEELDSGIHVWGSPCTFRIYFTAIKPAQTMLMDKHSVPIFEGRTA